MSTEFQHPYPDPKIAAVVERLKDRMSDLAQRQEELLPKLQAGTALAELHDGMPEDEHALYAAGTMLCNESEFRHALPIALYLVAHHGQDQRYAFMAGACLQRLGNAQEALAMYGLCMMIAGPQPAAMYRAGECLLSIGEEQQARLAFDEAYDLCYSSLEDYREIQDMASKRLEQLGATG